MDDRQAARRGVYGFTPIHLFVVLVLYVLPMGQWAIYRGDRVRHGRRMGGLFIGALVIAGAFTLLPGRFMAHMLFGW